MKTKLTYSAIGALLLIGGVIGGCGGSDSTTTTTSVTTQTGIFVDAAVEGLTYRGRLTGVTNEKGQYLFKGTERVTFLLGDKISLGDLEPKTSIVTPLDLFDGTKTVADQEVKNLLVLLQSLDNDRNTSNGIQILPAAVSSLETALVSGGYDPTTVNFADFNTSALSDVLLAAGVTAPVVTEADAVANFEDEKNGVQPPAPASDITGSALACSGVDSGISSDAADFNGSDPIIKRNISARDNLEDPARLNGNSNNVLQRLSATVASRSADGNFTGEGDVHPIMVSYNEQIFGTYEMGDGSADIGDPEHRDGVFVSTSLDEGLTWKKTQLTASEDKSSIQVTWNGATIDYQGHAQKPKMAVSGNNILVAWHDKYCPSGNPFDLNQTDEGTYPNDIFAVNGSQGSIDYEALVAPNDKIVYEVPFSCVWTARGVMDTDGNVTWRAPEQLTSGVRDSNHIWVEGSAAGFALSWQEDTTGLRSGKGEGPGEGWSGATTNHGTDIWYTSIKMDDFDDVNSTDLETTKPKVAVNFHYPVRITDNEKCSNDDTKAYCQLMCDTYGYVDSATSNNAETAITRCLTYDTDMLTDTQALLDGDTGASRSALKILTTDTDEHLVVFGYEETKGLSESDPGTGDQDQGTVDTNISAEGKSVYFESFSFNAIDSFDESNISTILTTPMPMVSAGNIVNVKVPDQNDTSNMIFENARRVVIGTQVDSCEADKFTFAFLYKQSFETQGASSDMFVRVNNGFTYGSFVALNDANLGQDLIVTNVSSQEPHLEDANATDYFVTWTPNNLDDNTYDDTNDNTFSPRIFLRGNKIFTGFVYTPNDLKTQVGNFPGNFHTHMYQNGAWQGPVNVTEITKGGATVVDPRLVFTPKGSFDTTGLESDKSNPDVLFITWGDMDYVDYENKDLGKAEADIWYKRSIDGGTTWDANASKVAAREGTVIEEAAVQSLVSPDGKTLYNVWLQEEEHETLDLNDPFSGLDTWFGRVDFNVSN